MPSTGEILPDVSDPIFYLFNDGWDSAYHTTIYSCAGDLANINLKASFGEQVMAPVEYSAYRKFLLNVPLSTVRRYYIYLMFMRTAGGTEHGELYIIAPRHLASIKTLHNVIMTRDIPCESRVSYLVLYEDIVGGSIPLPIHPSFNHYEEYLMGNSGEHVAPASKVPFTSTEFRISTAGEIGDIGHEPIRSLGYCMSALFIARIVDSRSRSQGDSYNRGGLTGSSMQSLVYDVTSIIHFSPHVCLERRVIIISVHIPIVRDEREPTMKFYASTIQSLLDAWGVISVMGDILCLANLILLSSAGHFHCIPPEVIASQDSIDIQFHPLIVRQ